MTPTRHRLLPPSVAAPIQVLDLELAGPLPRVDFSERASGRRYSNALGLVRLHGRPLGLVRLRPDGGRLSAAACAAAIRTALGPRIFGHLVEDGLEIPTGLGPDGLPEQDEPACRRRRREHLAAAPSATVIVATRDRPAALETCLAALAGLDYPAFQLVVVDNAPTSGATAAVVDRLAGRFAELRYVREGRPGLGWAHNRGLREARGAIIAFTDDDVVVDRSWLAELARVFTAGPNVGCVTGSIVPLQLETPAQIWFEQYGGFNKGFTPRLFDLAEHRPANRLYPYRAGQFGAGANMAFRADVLRDLGGFDPALGPGTLALGGEDLDAYYRVLTAGYQLAYEPGALVHHLHRREYAALRHQIFTWGVGLAAFLTKTMLATPRALPELGVRLPEGLLFTLAVRARGKQPSTMGPRDLLGPPSYPSELLREELRGLLCGPLAYLRSRRQARPVGDAVNDAYRQDGAVERREVAV